jgi:hypothetical protein
MHSPRSLRSSSSSECAALLAASIVLVFFSTTLLLQSSLEDYELDSERNLMGIQQTESSQHQGATDSGLSVLRRFQQEHPFDRDRIHSVLDPLRVSLPLPPADVIYDITHCPDQPPAGYPYEWNALKVLDHWGIDDTDIPSEYMHQGLCVFDWEKAGDRVKVETYRHAELPFVLKNHDQVLQTAERWSSDYVEQLLGDTPQRNEHSLGNHFMFWRERSSNKQRQQDNWTPPTDMVQLSYKEWLEKAHFIQASNNEIAQDRWYFRLNANRMAHVNTYLYHELPFFAPSAKKEPKLFMVDPTAERGINCRFGMKGVFSESHFDPSRNWIVVLGGQRRYLLSSYRQCPHLCLYPILHPSGRHSKVDWSNPRQNMADNPVELAAFGHATINEVVLQAGDALYLPTAWFHAIVSLNTNYQCNARSGVTHEAWEALQDCGFGDASKQ